MHLQAIETNRTCDCGDPGRALAEAFREFVVSRLPADLLDGLDVELEGQDFQVQAHLNRKPTEEELESMDRVIQHALAEFRTRIQEAR